MSNFIWYFSAAILLAFLNFNLDLLDRRVFLYDLWFGLAPLLFMMQVFAKKSSDSERRRILGAWFVGCAALGFYYLHGMLRPGLQTQLNAVGAFADGNHTSAGFSWGNDTISAWRFWTWFSALCFAWLVFKQTAVEKRRGVIERWGTLVFRCCIYESLLAGLAYYEPHLRKLAGIVWGYDPDYAGWQNRFYGTFASPVELGAALFLGWIWGFGKVLNEGPSLGRILGLGCIAFGLWGANTMNPLMAVFFGSAAATFLSWKNFSDSKTRRKILSGGAALGVLVLSALAVALLVSADARWYFVWKSHDFLFRLGPWKVFLDALLERWDFFLFGFGFSRGHSDSSWMVAMKIGGVSAVALLATTSMRLIARSRGVLGVGLATGFFVMGLFCDSYFFRSAGTLGWFFLVIHYAMDEEA